MRLLRSLFFIVMFLVGVSPAFPQDNEETIGALNKQVAELYGEGQYENAVPVALESLRLTEATYGPEHPHVATGLNNLGLLYKAQGRYDEAEPLYTRALEIDEAALGPEHPEVATSLNNLATLHQSQGRYADAVPLYTRALAIVETALGPEHSHVARSLNNLGVLYEKQGRYDEAEPLFTRALEIREAALGTEHLDVATSLNNLAALFRTQGRYADAEPLYTRALEIRETALGPEHSHVARSLNNLGVLYENQGRYDEAEPLYTRALAIYETALGPEHPAVATSLTNLGVLYQSQARYDEAEPLYTRALEIREAALGTEHLDVAHSRISLAALYVAQGRYEKAEPLYIRVLAIVETAVGPEHPNFATSLYDLGVLFEKQGRYGEAESLFTSALTVYETALGPEHPHVAQSRISLAGLYRAQGRYGEAEPLFTRALADYETALGPEHPAVATSLNNLAMLYRAQGRYDEAEPLYARALAIFETALGPEHPTIAASLNNLARLYQAQGRYVEAEPLFARALTVRETALGQDHSMVATSLNNLAALYYVQGRYDEAEPLYSRSRTIMESALGPAHPHVATNLNNLATLYTVQGRYDEAQPLFTHALAIDEATLGPRHPTVATDLNNLAELYREQGRYDEAEPLFAGAIAIRTAAFGPDHPDVAFSFDSLAELYHAQGRYKEALLWIRRTAGIYAGRAAQAPMGRSAGATAELSSVSSSFVWHALIAWLLSEERGDPNGELLNEAFGAAQMALQTDAGRALAQMGARFSSGENELSVLVKAREDGAAQWRAVNELINKERSTTERKVDQDKIARLREQLAGIDQRLDKLDGELRDRFPEYAELSSPKPLSLKRTQESLSSGEALVSFLVTERSTLIWVVTPEDASWRRSEIGQDDLADDVVKLRKGISHDGGAVRLDVAHKLYDKLVGPIEDAIEGVEHLIVVPSGPLQSLPFAVLLTEPPDKPIGTYQDLRQAHWLIRDFAISVLPSVSSLRAIRTYASAKTASSPFIGFGDPILDADWMKRSGLSELEETEGELRSIASALNAQNSDVFVEERATETSVKATSLEDYRVVAFATHGLVGGDPGNSSTEAALVMTLPVNPVDEDDDGLLTASEVALLNFNADWVILSACNTASGDRPGAEPLSGLARAFFYAGSKALLVSHWPVYSDAAVPLITHAFTQLKDAPGLGRAEAMRQAMISLMEDESQPGNAHPATWAPFIVVGEGGRLSN